MLKKTIICLWLVLLLATQALAASPEEGKAAPAFDTKLLSGADFSLAGAKGQVIIINFWATWCPPCRQEMPAIESYYQKHKQQGLKVVAVSMDQPADAAKVSEVMRSFSFDAALEKNTHYNDYGRIWRLPLTFVIDRKGILRKDGWYGPAGIDETLMENVVTPLLKTE